MDPRQYIVDRQAQDPDRNDSRMFRSSNGVEIFRMIDTLVVKHLPSVKEGKSSMDALEKFFTIFYSCSWHCFAS